MPALFPWSTTPLDNAVHSRDDAKVRVQAVSWRNSVRDDCTIFELHDDVARNATIVLEDVWRELGKVFGGGCDLIAQQDVWRQLEMKHLEHGHADVDIDGGLA